MRRVLNSPTRVLAVLALLTSVVWLMPMRAQTPGPPRTYTLIFEHDGVNTTSYEVLVDGVVTAVAVSCSGVLAGRTCSGPLTMTTNVTHAVVVKAVGLFGDATSDPFGAAPPTKPAAVGMR